MNYFFSSLLSAMKSITNLKIIRYNFEGDYCIAAYYVTTCIVVMLGWSTTSTFSVLTDSLIWMQTCKLSLKINLLKAVNISEFMQSFRYPIGSFFSAI